MGKKNLFFLVKWLIGCNRTQEFALVFHTRILTFLLELAGIFVISATRAPPVSFAITWIFVILLWYMVIVVSPMCKETLWMVKKSMPKITNDLVPVLQEKLCVITIFANRMGRRIWPFTLYIDPQLPRCSQRKVFVKQKHGNLWI